MKYILPGFLYAGAVFSFIPDAPLWRRCVASTMLFLAIAATVRFLAAADRGDV